MKKYLLIFAVLFLFVGHAFALPFNENRPFIPGINSTEDSLQTVFNDVVENGVIDAVNDQSDVAIWTLSEAVVDQYLITLLAGNDNQLGIYSELTGAEYLLGVGTTSTEAGFAINDAGELWMNGFKVDDSFGDKFGFYLSSENQVVGYTEDSKNSGGYGTDSNIMALTYIVPETYKVKTELYGGTTVIAEGNNDWILAFEDTPYGGDFDFQDAVFYVEDMDPVPEPATLFLLGAGLLGIAGISRRRSQA